MRPAVLLVDPDDERRHTLARGLAERGYEVIPAGKAKAMVGKLLGIKPILGVVDGEVAAIDRARGGRRADGKELQGARDFLGGYRPGGVGTHAGPGCVGTVVFQPTEAEWQLIRPLDGPD